MNQDEPATKQDVEEIVGRVVGEMVGDALERIAERFDKVDTDLNRIENKLDATIGQVDDQAVRLTRLDQSQTA